VGDAGADGGRGVSRSTSDTTGLGDEGRFELAMAASAQEKRNRPLGLPLLACVVLVASLVFAVWSLSARNAAMRERARAESDDVAVRQMTGDWEALRVQERDAPGLGLGERMPNLLSRMENLAREAGLKNTPANPQTSPDARPGIVVTTYSYRTVKDASLAALMEWVRKATEIPGMEVTELKLKAEATEWSVDVTFRRWERAG
jgi:hypothetical protein